MRVTVNGDPIDIDDATTVAALVDQLAGDRRGVAIAVNEEVAPRSTWAAAVLTVGDRVEVLRAAQGG